MFAHPNYNYTPNYLNAAQTNKGNGICRAEHHRIVNTSCDSYALRPECSAVTLEEYTRWIPRRKVEIHSTAWLSLLLPDPHAALSWRSRGYRHLGAPGRRRRSDVGVGSAGSAPHI